MYTTYHFGTILESNSYLQNMVTTFIFIILCNAPTITPGDVKLQINYFDLLMCFLQAIITMIWNCINTRNFGKLHEKLIY